MVIFVHGNAQNTSAGIEALKFFQGKGHEVLAYNLPGHGNSQPYKDGKYTMKKFAETLRCLIQLLQFHQSFCIIFWVT
jgi:pimeloyl-ACP methyl ester carboxylesterase